MTKTKVFILGMLASLVLGTTSLSAEKKIFIHGYSPVAWDGFANSQCQNQTSCAYWGDLKLTNGRFVGWISHMPWPYFGVPRLMEVLNQQCRGAEPCQILCHSTGCPITGYVLDHNPGYNISSVVNLAGASGGSELATLAAWIKNLLGPLQWIAELINGQGNYFLIPGVTRALYDHNDTSGVPISVVVGSKGEWYSWAVFPGKNDGVVAFHSSAGYVKAFSADVVSGATEFCWKTGQSCWRAWWGHTYCVSYPYPSSCGVARWNNHFLQSGMPNGGYGQYNHGEVGRTQSLYHR